MSATLESIAAARIAVADAEAAHRADVLRVERLQVRLAQVEGEITARDADQARQIAAEIDSQMEAAIAAETERAK